MAWIPVLVGFDPADRGGLSLAAETSTAFYSSILQSVLDARGGLSAILVEKTSAVHPVPLCSFKSGVCSEQTDGCGYDSIQSGYHHPCD